eukprot:5351013-Pyramimonas_sp.AAC.1
MRQISVGMLQAGAARRVGRVFRNIMVLRRSRSAQKRCSSRASSDIVVVSIASGFLSSSDA